jgi:hypothetical protein
MSAAVIMAMLGCSCSSAAGLFYTCTDGTLDVSNLNANTCFSFLTSNATTSTPTTVDMGINCQFITVEQTTSNNIILSDIEVYDMADNSLIVHTPPPEGSSLPRQSIVIGADTDLANFVDDEGTDTATEHTVAGSDTDKAKVVVDLGGLKKVHRVVLTNTATTADQSKICGAKLKFSSNEVDAAGVATKKVIEETPTIDFVASAYVYKITSDLDKWK